MEMRGVTDLGLVVVREEEICEHGNFLRLEVERAKSGSTGNAASVCCC